MIPQSHGEVVGGVQKNGVVGDLGSAAVSDGLQQQRPLVLLLASGEPELSPEPLTLLTHANIPISFMFLFASLLLSLTYVPAKRFRVTKPFGVTLILLYALSNMIMIGIEVVNNL